MKTQIGLAIAAFFMLGFDTEHGIADDDSAGLHFDASVLSDNAIAVRRNVMSMPSDDAFDALLNWVLPNSTIDRVRFEGFFVPTMASPSVMDDPAFESVDGSVLAVMPQLRAPVIDLLVQSNTPERRRKLLDRLNASGSNGEAIDTLEVECFRLMIDIGRRDPKAVDDRLAKILDHFTGNENSVRSDRTLWLECVTAAFAFDRLPSSRLVTEFASSVFERRAADLANTQNLVLQSQLGWLDSQVRDRQFSGTQDAIMRWSVTGDWLITSDFSESTCGGGRPLPLFSQNRKREVIHTRGHNNDYLMLRRPLTNDHTVQADMRPHSACNIQIGKTYLGAGWNRQSYVLGQGRSPRQILNVDDPWDKPKQYVHYRNEVHGQTGKTYLAGRLIRQTAVSQSMPSWLALRSWRRGARYRDVSVITDDDSDHATGVSMIGEPELFDWHPYHAASIGTADSHWRVEWDEQKRPVLIGQPNASLAGSFAERLLQYRRPLVEDGNFELDYFYDPPHADASIALGRLALRITPQGVAEHWVTDGRFDRTRLRPDNSVIRAEHQLDSAPIDLTPESWHHVELRLRKNRLTLALNGQSVFARKVPASLGRKLGVFYAPGREGLQVRDAKLVPVWEPAVRNSSQDLADPRVAKLDALANSLPVHFAHDLKFNDDQYVYDGSPRSAGQALQHGDGIHLSVTSSGPWSQKALSTRFGIRGDFDIRARFSNLDAIDAVKAKEAFLYVDLNDDFAHRIAASIGHSQQNGHEIKGKTTLTYPDQTKGFRTERFINESKSGQLRIVRQGSTLTTLMAPGNSPRFRILMGEEVSAEEIPIGSLGLMVVSNGGGRTGIVWNRLEIRAQQLRYQPPQADDQTPQVGVIDVASGKARALAAPTAPHTNVGSVLWSLNGRQLAYDQSAGSTRSSRLMLLSVDDGKSVDVGFGSMPSFSPDGKQIAFSAAGEGVGIQNIDGTARRILDRSGWGIQWSSDGKTLAHSRSGNITLFDVASGQSRQLFSGQAASRYSYLYWNMKWSRDSSKIVFKGRRRDNRQDEIAVVSVAVPNRLTILISRASNTTPNFSWSANDRRIMIPIKRAGDARRTLCYVPADGTGAPEQIAGLPAHWEYTSGDWSFDGKQIGITGKRFQEPVDWPMEPVLGRN